MAIRSFANQGTADIAEQRSTKRARRTLPVHLHRAALERLVLLDAAARLEDLAVWPSLNLEKLKGDRKGQHSIRIDSQHRICFVWLGTDAGAVEIVDYH
jgi:proteic killer suppression protein